MEFEFDPAESADNKAWREVDFEEAQDKDPDLAFARGPSWPGTASRGESVGLAIKSGDRVRIISASRTENEVGSEAASKDDSRWAVRPQRRNVGTEPRGKSREAAKPALRGSRPNAKDGPSSLRG
jgi:hypothetical protein